MLCIATFYVQLKPHFLNWKKKFTGGTLGPMIVIIIPGPYTHINQSKTFLAKCNFKVNCEKNGFDN